MATSRPRRACSGAARSLTVASPIHLQPYLRERFRYAEGDFPVTESLASRAIALPFLDRLQRGDVTYVAGALAEPIAGVQGGGRGDPASPSGWRAALPVGPAARGGGRLARSLGRPPSPRGEAGGGSPLQVERAPEVAPCSGSEHSNAM